MTAAAETAGVGRTTLYRWLNDPAFATALRQAKREHVAAIHGSLRGLATGAVAVLGEALKAPSLNLGYRATLALRILKATGGGEPEDLGAESGEAQGRSSP